MNSKSCPKCSANLEIATIGELQDKVFLCRYCRYMEDIPDAYSVSEEQRSADGQQFRKKVVRRWDTPGGAGSGNAAAASGSHVHEALARLAQDDLHLPADVRQALTQALAQGLRTAEIEVGTAATSTVPTKVVYQRVLETDMNTWSVQHVKQQETGRWGRILLVILSLGIPCAFLLLLLLSFMKQ